MAIQGWDFLFISSLVGARLNQLSQWPHSDFATVKVDLGITTHLVHKTAIIGKFYTSSFIAQFNNCLNEIKYTTSDSVRPGTGSTGSHHNDPPVIKVNVVREMDLEYRGMELGVIQTGQSLFIETVRSVVRVPSTPPRHDRSEIADLLYMLFYQWLGMHWIPHYPFTFGHGARDSAASEKQSPGCETEADRGSIPRVLNFFLYKFDQKKERNIALFYNVLILPHVYRKVGTQRLLEQLRICVKEKCEFLFYATENDKRITRRQMIWGFIMRLKILPFMNLTSQVTTTSQLAFHHKVLRVGSELFANRSQPYNIPFYSGSLGFRPRCLVFWFGFRLFKFCPDSEYYSGSN
ncbi:hypothetical protein K438DRAFT_1779601 [Mycena galopus ATCC 62051]|nr:hypothetical protein K438DRAFT_1779601 [Mycena galopus ATCC 62051]